LMRPGAAPSATAQTSGEEAVEEAELLSDVSTTQRGRLWRLLRANLALAVQLCIAHRGQAMMQAPVRANKRKQDPNRSNQASPADASGQRVMVLPARCTLMFQVDATALRQGVLSAVQELLISPVTSCALALTSVEDAKASVHAATTSDTLAVISSEITQKEVQAKTETVATTARAALLSSPSTREWVSLLRARDGLARQLQLVDTALYEAQVRSPEERKRLAEQAKSAGKAPVSLADVMSGNVPLDASTPLKIIGLNAPDEAAEANAASQALASLTARRATLARHMRALAATLNLAPEPAHETVALAPMRAQCRVLVTCRGAVLAVPSSLNFGAMPLSDSKQTSLGPVDLPLPNVLASSAVPADAAAPPQPAVKTSPFAVDVVAGQVVLPLSSVIDALAQVAAVLGSMVPASHHAVLAKMMSRALTLATAQGAGSDDGDGAEVNYSMASFSINEDNTAEQNPESSAASEIFIGAQNPSWLLASPLLIRDARMLTLSNTSSAPQTIKLVCDVPMTIATAPWATQSYRYAAPDPAAASTVLGVPLRSHAHTLTKALAATGLTYTAPSGSTSSAVSMMHPHAGSAAASAPPASMDQLLSFIAGTLRKDKVALPSLLPALLVFIAQLVAHTALSTQLTTTAPAPAPPLCRLLLQPHSSRSCR